MTADERVREELKKIGIYSLDEGYWFQDLDELAHFILEDRKRVVAPAKEAIWFYENVKGGNVPDDKMLNEMVHGLKETLKNAGVEV